MVRHGKNGLLFDAEVRAAAIAAVRELLETPGRRRFLARQGRKTAENASWENGTRKLVGEYERAVAPQRNPRKDAPRPARLSSLRTGMARSPAARLSGMVLPPDLLSRPAEEAARRIALGWLAEARAASARLDDPDDAEALHDFRVAIRRLRSTLRAWRSELAGSVPGKLRRALRALQQATGEGRDAEVALAWLGRLTERLALMPTVTSLDDRLAPRAEVPRFGSALASRARDGTGALGRRLAAVGSVQDRAACHAARMAGKRLRYLLEPLRQEASVAPLIERCKALQDLLGDLNDSHVLDDEIAKARADAPAGALPGLEALAALVRARADALFARLRDEWLGGGAAALAAAVDSLAGELEAGDASGVEIERKYLLDRLPDLDGLRARGLSVETLEVEQGWLPGQRLRERVRRTTRAADPSGEVRYFRTVKLGAGVERIEIEEPTSAHVFETLWTLTEGCRIRKRRHCVRDEGRLWEIDEFLDRDLALAEVELPDAAVRPELPRWLEECVVREVTDDARYTNLSLARHGVPAEGA